jgi:YggT family protein
MSGLFTVIYFLFSLGFGLIIFFLWARLVLRYLNISALNSFSQLIHTLTNPIVNPINDLLKYPYQPGQRYDWTGMGVLVLIEFLKFIILSLIAIHFVIPITYLIIYVVCDLIIQPCDFLFYAILIRVIMSYTNPQWHHPIADVLFRATDPLLKMGRRIIPDISGFDFSPFIMMIILKVISLFLASSLPMRF